MSLPFQASGFSEFLEEKSIFRGLQREESVLFLGEEPRVSSEDLSEILTFWTFGCILLVRFRDLRASSSIKVLNRLCVVTHPSRRLRQVSRTCD